jgi:hypothetical protein
MASRARLALAGLALSLVTGLALLTWVALGADPASRAASARASAGRGSAAAAPAGDARALEAEVAREGSDDAAEDAARVGLAAAPSETSLAWSGRVVETDGGDAIEGAEVALTAGERTAAVHTDAQGRFELAWPAGLAAELAIRHPRYVDAAAARVDLAHEGRFALERSASLRGSVQPAGVEGTLTVWLQSAGSSRYWTSASAPIGSDGRFAFGDLTPGEYLLAGRVSARALAPEAGLRLEPGEEREIALHAREGARVLGRVLGEPGRAPLAGQTVTAEPRHDDLPREWSRDATLESVSDDEGRFEFAGLVPGEWQIVARSGSGQRIGRELDVAASGERHEVELLLPLAAALGGRVVDASGAGVAGCELAVFGRANNTGPFLEGGGLAQTVSDAQGWFQIEDVEPQSNLIVVARTPLGGAERPERYGITAVPRLDPAASQRGVLVELRSTASVSGRVLSASGEPIAALVTANVRIDNRARTTAAAQADADGRFRIERLPGAGGSLEARAEGWRSGRIPCEFDGSEIELRLEPAHALEGWAVDAQGLAVAGVPISLQPAAASGNERESRRQRRSGASDATGHFRFEDLQPGTWEVRGGSYAWRLAGDVPPRVEIPASGPLELVFERDDRPARGTIEGEAALPGGEAPTGIELEGLEGGVLAVERGRFRVSGATPTLQRLTLRADGHARVPLEPFQLAPGGFHDLGRVQLEPATQLVVRVSTKGGGELDGARVRLLPLPVEEGGAGTQARPLRLDGTRRGRYETTDATRHVWRLVVDRPGHKRHSDSVQVLEQATQTIEVELEPE